MPNAETHRRIRIQADLQLAVSSLDVTGTPWKLPYQPTCFNMLPTFTAAGPAVYRCRWPPKSEPDETGNAPARERNQMKIPKKIAAPT